MQIIAIVNQKGGVGKTTTTANLSHAIALAGHKAAVIDFDPQGHLSAYLGFAGQEHAGVGYVITTGANPRSLCIEARKQLDLLPAGSALKEVEIGPSRPEEIRAIFRESLRSAFAEHEHVFIDCPPASGVLIQYALSVADMILVPVAGDYLSLRGLSDLIGTLSRYASEFGALKQHMVITRFHMRRRLCWDVREKLLEYFPGQILATAVRETAALAESPSFGKTVFEYRNSDYGADDYRALAGDFIEQRFMQ